MSAMNKLLLLGVLVAVLAMAHGGRLGAGSTSDTNRGKLGKGKRESEELQKGCEWDSENEVEECDPQDAVGHQEGREKRENPNKDFCNKIDVSTRPGEEECEVTNADKCELGTNKKGKPKCKPKKV